MLRVEFARQSDNGRITLVVEPGSPEIRSLWAVMDTDNLDLAKSQLMAREGTKREDWVSAWAFGGPAPNAIPSLPGWAAARGVAGAVWTSLPTQFDKKNVTPTADQVVNYLVGLEGVKRDEAERYIRRAPRQVDTPNRRRIEIALGWTHLP